MTSGAALLVRDMGRGSKWVGMALLGRAKPSRPRERERGARDWAAGVSWAEQGRRERKRPERQFSFFLSFSFFSQKYE
jgi:hypothetical protein